MGNDIDRIPTQTWEVFRCARDIVGDTDMLKIFNRGVGQLRRYSTPSEQRNPLDRIKLVFELLVKEGARETVISAINMLGETVNCRLHPNCTIVPDKNTVEEELMDDYKELGKLVECYQRRENPALVTRQVEMAVQEIEETHARYLKLYEKYHAK